MSSDTRAAERLHRHPVSRLPPRRLDHGRAGAGRVEALKRPSAGLPVVVYALALGTFLMGTTEFVVAGLLPEIAGDQNVSVARAGLSITVFAVGMILGAPLMTMLTRDCRSG